MRTRHILPTMLSAGALAAASLVAAPAAQAAPREPWRPAQIRYVKITKVDGVDASVVAKYRCFGGNNEQTHVWVSIKQGPKITAMSLDELIDSEGTSQVSKAWYNSNIPAPGATAPVALTANCDGQWHREHYKIYRQLALENQDGSAGRKLGKLKNGRVFLQYCLIDSYASQTDENDPTGVNWDYHKPKIKVTKHH